VAYWWVNQNQTWRHEIFGEYLWAPQVGADGHRRVFWDNMTLLEPGDIVLSHFDGALRYAGVVISHAVADRKPDFGFAGNAWADNGWSVEMRFTPFESVIRPKEHLEFYNQVAPERYAPMNASGRVNQQYLFALPSALGAFYMKLGGRQVEEIVDVSRLDASVDAMLQEASNLLANSVLTTTERHVLARARMGQGMFKAEVSRIEPACRLTGVTDFRHLIASHMKPWSISDNAERVSGNNGLLLSPHVDNLFDRGLITFTPSGAVKVSPRLNPDVPSRWKLDLLQSGRKFTRNQLPFLEYHQEEIFHSTSL
jgi:putative restriction endonuclease